MTDELKQLIQDAARFLGLEVVDWFGDNPTAVDGEGMLSSFNPANPERGDLMKVVEAADIVVGGGSVYSDYQTLFYIRDDYQSLVLAVLRAASAMLKARGE